MNSKSSRGKCILYRYPEYILTIFKFTKQRVQLICSVSKEQIQKLINENNKNVSR